MRTSRKKYLKRILQHFVTGIVIGLVLVSVALFLFDRAIFAGIAINLSSSPTITPVPTETVIPTTTPMPTITPTPKPPTPTPYSGFCLTVPVLMYHHIQPMQQAIKTGQTTLTVDSNIFSSQMAYLSSHGYHTITAEDLINALRTKQKLPPKTIVITADDGYSDIYTYAYPVAKQYGFILNLMLATGLLENPGYLTWNNVKEMINSGAATAYNHTWSHFALNGGNTDKQQTEILTAKQQLESNLGKTNTIFTYPFGTVTNDSLNILTKNGFTGAFGTVGGTVQCDSFLYTLHRTRIGSMAISGYGF